MSFLISLIFIPLQLCDFALPVQMAESEVPVYTTNDHFQGPDAHNAEQARAEMVRFQNMFSTWGPDGCLPCHTPSNSCHFVFV